MTKFPCPVCNATCTADPKTNGAVTLKHPPTSCFVANNPAGHMKILLEGYRLTGSPESLNFFELTSKKTNEGLDRIWEKEGTPAVQDATSKVEAAMRQGLLDRKIII